MENTNMFEKLKQAGADVEGTMGRFMGNESLYLKFLRKFPEDGTYDEMQKAYQAGDVETVFRASHTIKGVTANLGLNPLMESVIPVVECCRKGQMPSEEDMKAVETCYFRMVDIIREFE